MAPNARHRLIAQAIGPVIDVSATSAVCLRGGIKPSYIGPDGARRYGPETFERKAEAERFLALVEVQLATGDWTNPAGGRISVGDYAAIWIGERPGLRVRTIDLYRWLLAKHIDQHLGSVPIGKVSTQLVREWRSGLLESGVSPSVAAKAYGSSEPS